MRYEKQAWGWWFHDFFVHPFSGTIGLIGNLTRSFRLMALAHHLHNGSAPSNDAIGDYIEAAARACRNESPDDPRGSMTPDEQDWAREQARIATGRTDWIDPTEAVTILKSKSIKPWSQHAEPGISRALLTRKEVDEGERARRLMAELEDSERALNALLNRTFNRYEIRDMGEEGKEALRSEVAKLEQRVEMAQKALRQEKAGTSVKEILAK